MAFQFDPTGARPVDDAPAAKQFSFDPTGAKLVEDDAPAAPGLIPTIKRTGGQMLTTAATTLEDVTGPNAATQAMRETGQGIIDRNPAGITSLRDVVDSPWLTVKESVGQFVPQIGAAAVGGLAGAKAGAALGSLVGPAGAAAGGAIGGLAGGLAPIFAQEYGGIRQEQQAAGQEDKGRALAAAIPATALERVGMGKALKVLKGVPGGAAGTVLKEAGKGVLKEGATEGAQNVIEQWGAFKDPTTGENLEDTALAAVMGGIGGGVVGAGTGAVDSARRKAAANQPAADAPAQPEAEPAPLLLGNTPDPLVQFPDGTVGRRSEVEAYIAGLPDEQQTAARAALYGYAPQPAEVTTSPGAADLGAAQQQPMTMIEALEAETALGAQAPRDGIDFTREFDDGGLTMEDPAEIERARAATIDYEPTTVTPQWGTAAGAAPERQPGLDMPAPEFDTAGLQLDTRTPSEQMGINPAAGPLSRAAAQAVDTQSVQSGNATGFATTADQGAYESGALAFQQGATRQELAAIPNVAARLQHLRGYDDAARQAAAATTAAHAASTTGDSLARQAQTVQASPQQPQAGGQAPAGRAAAGEAQPVPAAAAPAGGGGVQAAGLSGLRPEGWRKTMLKAGPVAQALGIDTRGKRLAQVVAEIDALDARAEAPLPRPASDGPVLQNRNRATPSSIAQMQAIAARPDYGRMGPSRDFANGAPVVAGGQVPAQQLGRQDVAVASDGRRIPVQYAVVEAGDVLASNQADGRSNPEYGQATGAIRAIAGNGRIAGIQAAHQRGTAGDYVRELAKDAAMHGIDPAVVQALRAPVLVRVMPTEAVTDNIGDVSNTQNNLQLSAVEQADNDRRRVDLQALEFAEDGAPTADTVRGFVRAMPASEQGALIDTNGQPTAQAADRLNAAIFASAYGNDGLVRLYAQAADPEARLVLSALARVAPKMARLEGAGALDIRDVVAQAAEIAVNARRQGVPLARAAEQLDMAADPLVGRVLDLFARNPRSNREAIERLSDLADLAYAEATKADVDMFGEVPRLERAQVFDRTLEDANEQTGEENLAQPAGREPVRGDAGGQVAVERAAPADAGAAQAGRPAEAGQPPGQGAARSLTEEQQAAIQAHGLPQDAQFSAGKGALGAGKWIARAQGEQGALSDTIDQAARSLASRLTGQASQAQAQEARRALAEKVAAKITRGEQPTDVELNDLFGLAASHTYVDQAAVGQFLVDYLGVPRNGIRAALGKAVGDRVSDGGARYPIVYPRKLHEVFGRQDDAEPVLTAPTRSDILERQQAQERARADEARAEREAEQRAQADAEVDGFTLTGSDRAADVAEAQGQQPMFSRKEARGLRNLVTLHNLSADNLLHADRLGGIPAPSIGITKVDAPFSGFGDITLIAPKGMIDPANGVPVYDRDAWTARFPALNFKKPKAKQADALYERMQAARELPAGDDGFSSQLWEAMRNASVTSPDKIKELFTRYEAPRALYAKEVLGKEIKPTMRTVPLRTPHGGDKPLVAYWKKHGAQLQAIERDMGWSAAQDTDAFRAFGEQVRQAIERTFPTEGDGAPRGQRLRDSFLGSAFNEGGQLRPGEYESLRRDFDNAGKREVDRMAYRKAVDRVVKSDDAGYQRWVEDLVKPLFEAPTITLRGKEVEATLDNIVAAMTVGATAGVEKSLTYSPGKVAAVLGKRFKSLAEIQAARDQVTSEAQEAEGKKAADALLDEYRQHVAQFYTYTDWRGNVDTWAANDAAMEALAKAGKAGETATAVRMALGRAGFKAVDDRAVQLARQAIGALRNSATNYFEAKPQRAVQLREFAGAVVPRGIGADALAVLEKNGIAVEMHGKGEGAREKAILKLANRLDKERGDVRFSFAGQQAATADRHALASAQQRLEAGADAEAVRRGTGWHRGADGKWRFEISDADAMLTADTSGSEGRRSIGQMYPAYAFEDDGGLTVGKMLHHPALFAAYPAIADMPVTMASDILGEGYRGGLSLASATITLNRNLSWREGLSTLLHEIQHGIQNIEGFATGGSPKTFADRSADGEMLRDGATLAVMLRSQGDIGKAKELFERRIGREPAPGAESAALSGESPESMRARAEKMLSPQEQYRRQAGEVEARNTQARQSLTDEQRRATPPSSTADVADADVIVTFNGREMASAPAPANTGFSPEQAAAIVSAARPPSREASAASRRLSDERLVATQLLVDGLAERWSRAPEIIVARDMQDEVIPQHVRDYDAKLKSQGASGEPQGFILRGKVYLLSDTLSTPNDIATVLFHEVLGHWGLRRAFGDALDPILRQVAVMRGKDVRAKAREYGLDFGKESDRLIAAEEVLAEMAQANPQLGFVQRAVAAIRNWLRQHVPGFRDLAMTNNDIIQAFILPARGAVTRDAETTSQALERSLAAVRGEPLFSRAAAMPGAGAAPAYDDYTAAQRASAERVFGTQQSPDLRQRWDSLRANLGPKLKQGLVDQFAPIKEYSDRAYMLARMTKGTDGAVEAAMLYGKPFLRDGVLDVKVGDGGFAQVLANLKGEHDRFFQWVAAQRAERLKAEGKENLLTDQDITALKSLNAGRMADGTPRFGVYAQALKDLNDFNEANLQVALQSGLIDQAAYDLMRDQPYVPFYRLMEEGGDVQGPRFSAGLVNQQAWKKLKGGTQQINHDLLHNMLLNWSSLYAASARNRAALEALSAADGLGIAHRVPAGTKGAVQVRRAGLAESWMVEDPHLMDAITAMSYTPGVLASALAPFKRVLTMAVTVNPTFKVRNLIRDTLSAMAQSELGYNPLANVVQGWKALDKGSQTHASMLASGGIIRFGTLEDSGKASRQVEKLGGQVLDQKGWKKLTGQLQSLWSVYEELGDKSENANRAALYEQLIAKGHSHAEASFMARDLMDFSMSGQWEAVRFLAQTVPFLNARLQGLYKLGRAAHQDPKKFAIVTGAVASASLALLAAYGDDDDWKKREDWDRDTYWWFKIGDTAFRIPKPFEVGAIGTLAERTAEWMLDKEMTNARFGQRLSAMVFQTFAMDPTPQALKPLLDVYANKDSFSGRPIEGMADERLRPQDRYNERTSEVARLLGSMGLPDPVKLAKGDYEALSPKQVDFLLRGYFGWLATAGTTASDYALRPLMDRGERPAMQMRDVFLAGNFMEQLPTGSSRYVSTLYEQSRAVEQVWASYQAALKSGDVERAQAIRESEGETLARRSTVQGGKTRLAELSLQARRIEADRTLSAAEKRARLDAIAALKDRAARAAAPL